MKGKITMTICVGCTALILTMIMFTQFKTVDETDITAIETMRETELRTELASWKTKYEEIEKKLEEVNTKINEYNSELDNNANTSNVLQNEVKEAEAYIGNTSLQGQGIIITLKDSGKNVRYAHLLQLVNELNAAGAEAISINDERIISMSEIAKVKDKLISINERKITAPFTVKAIGDKKYLESAITIKGGYVDEIKANVDIIILDFHAEATSEKIAMGHYDSAFARAVVEYHANEGIGKYIIAPIKNLYKTF